jgi:hypothetical protein
MQSPARTISVLIDGPAISHRSENEQGERIDSLLDSHSYEDWFPVSVAGNGTANSD